MNGPRQVWIAVRVAVAVGVPASPRGRPVRADEPLAARPRPSWWAKDVVGPVADVYGDYLAPRSPDNARLDAEFRAVLGRKAVAPLADDDRRAAVFDLARKWNQIMRKVTE